MSWGLIVDRYAQWYPYRMLLWCQEPYTWCCACAEPLSLPGCSRRLVEHPPILSQLLTGTLDCSPADPLPQWTRLHPPVDLGSAGDWSDSEAALGPGFL
jgi:hypothetical protein